MYKQDCAFLYDGLLQVRMVTQESVYAAFSQRGYLLLPWNGDHLHVLLRVQFR